MKKVYLIILPSIMFFSGYAALNGKCTPAGMGSGFSGVTTFCKGVAASALNFNYTECSSGTGPAIGIPCTATWYYNTTNSTAITSSTVMVSAPVTFTSAAGVNGNLPSVTPITSTAGTYYYFCVVKWSIAGSCTSPYITSTQLIVINSTPPAINGASSVCAGSTIMLSDIFDGGTWSSGNTSDAIVGISGIVTGVTGSTSTTITYTLGTGCKATKAIAINPLPAAITGTANVCNGATTTLNDATIGGTWSSSNTAIATITASHIVSGLTAGVTSIAYTLATGCAKSITLTVNQSPAAINGAKAICTGSTLTLSNVFDGGVWSSSNTANALIGSATGMLTGITGPGTATISYTLLSDGCKSTSVVTINPLPAPITGPDNVCAGATTTLADATPGGTWSSSNVAIATINATHVVTGIAPGMAIISYILATGCGQITSVNVNQSPAPIAGTNALCVGTSTTLSDIFDGGEWSSSSTGSATIGSTNGVVTGITGATTATIAYTLMSNGCKSTMILSVIPNPADITGSTNLCTGTTTILSNTIAGGWWSSNNPETALISATTGVVTAIASGTTIITYSLGAGCYSTKTVSINITPGVTTGSISPIITGAPSTALNFHTTGAPATYNIAWGTAAQAAGFANITSSPLDTLASDSVLHIAVPTTAIAATYTGTLSVASTGCVSQGALIRAIINDSLIIYAYAGNATNGNSGNGGAATIAQISHPSSVASDCNGNTYIADYDNGVVRKVDATGTISIFAGNGTIGYSGDGGAATAAELSTPTGVAIDGYGNVYISDYNNMVVRKVNTDGIISTFAGNGGHGYSGDGGVATSAELNYPVGLAVDNANNVYITDYLNSVIRKVNTSGIITTVAGNGTAGYTGDNSAAISAQLNNPRGVAVDAAGNIYIADYGNNVIRKVNTSGIITTIAGNGTEGYSGDGNMATSATLNNPWGIAVDGHNNIYFSELHNNVIRKVDSTGMISTIAGNYALGEGFSSNGKEGITAQLDQPMGISINCTGNLFIADNANYAVRILGAYDRAPFFTGGATQTMYTFSSVPSLSLNMNLAVADYDTLQNETWSIVTGPIGGTVSVSYSTVSTGNILTPSGLTYTTAAGFTGLDSFTVQVTDGKAIATTKIYVNVSGISDRMASTGVNNTPVNSISLQVFPNPSKGDFNIKTSEAGTFYLLSMEGQSVSEYSVNDAQTEITIPSGLPSGIYMGRFKNADGNTTDVKIVYEP